MRSCPNFWLMTCRACAPRRVMELFAGQMGEHGAARARSLAGRTLPGISKKMLVQTLRDMEMRGLLARHVYTVVPPKVEYELTALGKTFAAAVEMLYRWGQEHTAALDELELNTRRSQALVQ